MGNINPNFNGKKDINSDLFAYIDESGTDCLRTKNILSEEWFVVSGIIMNFNSSNLMLRKIIEYKNHDRPKTNLQDLTFKQIRNHNQKLNLLAKLSNFNYLTVHSAFFKSKIKSEEYKYPSVYFVGLKNVIERLSWLTKQFNKNRVHVFISKRNQIDSESFSNYLFKYSVRAQRNLMYINKLGYIFFIGTENQPKLLLSDYSTSSIRHCLEKRTEIDYYETSYFDIFLKGKLYSSNHSQYRGVWRNGFKCTPDDKKLIGYCGILEEGSHEL